MTNMYIDRRGSFTKPDENSIIRSRSGAFAVITYNNKILFSKHPCDLEAYELPGGGIDEGESVEQALIRETQEETGLSIESHTISDKFEQDIQYFAKGIKPASEFWNYNMKFYSIDVDNVESLYFDGIRDNQEGGKVEWVEFDKLNKSLIISTHKPAIEKLLGIKFNK